MTTLGYAQKNYYTKDIRHITADGITFVVEHNEYNFILWNVCNKLDTIPTWFYKDGRELMTQEEYDAVFFKPAGKNTVDRAIVNTFTEREMLPLRVMRDAPIAVYYVIDSEGNTVEVAFIVDAIPEMLCIPPEKFALLEKNLKKEVKWELNDAARRLQFVTADGFINFRMLNTHYVPPGKLPSGDPALIPEPDPAPDLLPDQEIR